LKFRNKISKKLVVRLLIFVTAIGFASLLDIYLEKNQVKLDEIQASTEQPSEEHSTVYVVNQVFSNCNAKTPLQKAPDRKLFQQSHDKFLQKYHQLRNYQVLKAEAKNQKITSVLSWHILAVRDYYCIFPDDDPLVS